MEPRLRPRVVVGAAPILRSLADRIGLVAVVDQLVTWDAERCRRSPGVRIVVLNLLTDRQPLYPVTDAFRLTDVPLLLGPGVAAEDLTDDAWGRALDRLAAAGLAAVFSAVAARAYAGEAIDGGGIPFDTTSRSLYGEYPPADGTHGVTPRHGHPKDHRDDLKHILYTCFVNREGVPLMGTVGDGHRTDKRLNRQQIDQIVRAFSPAAVQARVYIADSALVTGPNLDALATSPLAWLSRLADTFGAAATAKAVAWAANARIPVDRVAQSPHTTTALTAQDFACAADGGDRRRRVSHHRSPLVGLHDDGGPHHGRRQ
ncbi:MAG: IS1634 family transposase, partial [Clostridia bacterium]